MAAFAYLDFDLLLERVASGYRARVLRSPAGETVNEFQLPLSNLELENFLLRMGRPRRKVRRLETPETLVAKTVGGQIFGAVFSGPVLGYFQNSLEEARRQDAGLRIKLRLTDAPELADLPWEYLYHPALNRFLALSKETPVVRFLETPERPRTLSVTPPLRVLVMIANPDDYEQLDVAGEWGRLHNALGDLEQRGVVTLEVLDDATLPTLQRQLRRGDYHIFHFIGHGGFDETAQDGALLLEDQTGRGRAVSGQNLGTLLNDHRSLRLVILNACEGARASRSDPFAGTAQSLLQQGLPAVIAMQFEITDEAAVTFAHEFYAALADGLPVDAAMAEARRAIFASGNLLEWGTPVLYMRAPDGRIFDIVGRVAPQAPGPQPTAEHLAELYDQALGYYYTDQWPKAIQLLKDVLAAQPTYEDAATKLAAAQRQQALCDHYNAGLAAYQAGDWAETTEQLTAAVALDPGYRDASARLADAQRRHELAELYTEAQRVFKTGNWQAVVNICQRIADADPAYPDLERLLAAAHTELAEAERRAEAAATDSEGLGRLEAGARAQAEAPIEGAPEQQPVQPQHAEEPRPQPSPPRGKRRSWLWAAIAGLVTIALMALLISQVGRDDSGPTPVPVRTIASTQPPPRPSQTSVLVVRPTAVLTQITRPTAAQAHGPGQTYTGIITQLSAPSCDYGGEIKAIEALDDLRVRFTLCYPDVAFPAKVALPPFGIHPAEYLAATAGTPRLLEAPIGTGPYRLTEWRRDEFIRMEVNPDYWGEPAQIRRLEFHWLDDWDSRLGYLEAADVGGIDDPPPQAHEAIRRSADLRLYPRAGLNTGYLGISNLANPFGDVRVRWAVALAIDREELVASNYPPGTTVATHFTPCEIPSGCVGEPWHGYDPGMARRLLAEAGYPDGFETEIFYRDAVRSFLLNPGQIAGAIASMLMEHLNVRVKLTPVEMEADAFRKAAWNGEFPLYLLGQDDVYPDPADYLSPIWGEFATERSRIAFTEIWGTLQEATVTTSPETRAELYAEANSLIKRTVPLVPLVHVGSAAAFRSDVVGAHSSPLRLEEFAAMSLRQGSTLIWKQATMPRSLYCADETDTDAWRACAQITESLLSFKTGSAALRPALAVDYEPNNDLTEWTFHLRPGVRFHDGSELDATDVVTSWAVMWDEANPLHTGRTGEFAYFQWLFISFLHPER